MKWMIIAPLFFLLAACCCTNTGVVEYRQVSVAPAYQTIRVINTYPVDVTTTTVEYF